MSPRIIRAVPIAAVATAALLFPGAANASNTATTASFQGWAAGPPDPTTGSFTAVSKTLCNSGTWSTWSVNNNAFLKLTCTNGVDSISFAQTLGRYKGKTDGEMAVQSGTGAYAGVSGQLFFVQDSGTTGIWSGSIS